MTPGIFNTCIGLSVMTGCGRDTNADGEDDSWGLRKGILRGDFGRSYTRGKRPVMDMIQELVIPTLELTASALFVGLIFGIPIGILAAIQRGWYF